MPTSLYIDIPGPDGCFQSRVDSRRAPPSDADCYGWWDRYAMPEHIRAHSLLVAHVATWLAERATIMESIAVDVQAVRASALLHDLAKAYTIRYGGSHAQLGGSWVMELTGDPVLAQGVLHHVYWPFELDVARYFMPMAVIYADKRARHTELVTIDDRFDDLMVRYGSTEEIRKGIAKTLDQSRVIEERLSDLLQVELHAHTFDSGRLVG